MKEPDLDAVKGPPTKKIASPSFFIGNEVIDIFLPLMGTDCLAVYSYLKRKEFTNPTLRHSVRDVAPSIKRSPSTISRSLEILEHLYLLRPTHFAGNKASECELLESVEAAKLLGAVYQRKTISWSLPTEAKKRLENEIKTIRQRQQGKLPSTSPCVPCCCGNLFPRVSQRNASVSLVTRKRPTRETRTGSHLIQEERRIEEVPPPTPAIFGEAEKSKDSSDEDEPDLPLKWATAVFTGVMNDLGDDLFNTSRPRVPHLANGAADWDKFGFDSLAVEAAEWRGAKLALVLSARDATAARSGLEKYRRKWNESVRNWFGCEVCFELQEARRGKATEC